MPPTLSSFRHEVMNRGDGDLGRPVRQRSVERLPDGQLSYRLDRAAPRIGKPGVAAAQHLPWIEGIEVRLQGSQTLPTPPLRRSGAAL